MLEFKKIQIKTLKKALNFAISISKNPDDFYYMDCLKMKN